MIDYLHRYGGSDILFFDSPQAASEAAWAIREEVDPDVIGVVASYDKVFLELQ